MKRDLYIPKDCVRAAIGLATAAKCYAVASVPRDDTRARLQLSGASESNINEAAKAMLDAGIRLKGQPLSERAQHAIEVTNALERDERRFAVALGFDA